MNHGRRIDRAARRSAALAAALAALLSAAISTPAEAASGLAGRIAYGSSDTLIGSVEGDGTRGKTAFDRHTGGEGAPWSVLKLRDPAYSPDGRKIAFSGTFLCDGCALETSRIGVVDADGHAGQPLIVADAVGPAAPVRALGRPAWSADGKTIAFQGIDNAPALFTVPATGGTPARIALAPNFREPAEPAYSPDGRFLAFSALDAEGDRRVYVKNLDDGAVTQITTGGGRQALPAFAADSLSIAYVNTPLAPAGGFGFPELAVRPLGGGAPDILWSNQVEQGRFVVGRPAFAPDGSRIAFSVTKPGDAQCAADLMVVDADGAPNPRSIGCESATEGGSVDWAVRTAKGLTRLVSSLPGSTRESGDGTSEPATVAANGRYEVFTSAATNLVAGITDDNAKTDVFRRDLASGKTELMSIDRDGKIGNGASDKAMADADGSEVAFRSTSNDLINGAVVGGPTVYVRHPGHTGLVSRSLNRPFVGAIGDNKPVAITPSGRYILWSSTAVTVMDGQEEAGNDTDVDLFVFDANNNKTHLVSAKAGSQVATGNGGTGAALISDDGQTVVFESTATDLVPGFVDHNGDAPSLFRRDLNTGTTTLVDGAGASANDSANAGSQLQGLTANGQNVLFQTAATDVVANFVNNNADAPDLYVRRTSAPVSFLITGRNGSQSESSNATSGLINREATVSANGSRVFFNSNGTDLNGEFTVNPNADQVWTRKLDNGAPTAGAELVTRGSQANQGANNGSAVVDASADGAFVLVSSMATDLTAPLKHHENWPTLYRIALSNFDAEPISARGDDTADREPIARRGGMAADGNVIAYSTRATNLLDGLIDGNGPEAADAYAWLERSAAERDPIDPTITLVTPDNEEFYRQDTVVLADYECADEGPSGLKSCIGTVPNGQPIDTSDTGEFQFTVTAVDNAGNDRTMTVTYRVAAANKKLALASRALGAGAKLTTGNNSSEGAVYSADGRYLVFTSEATNLVADFIDGNTAAEDDVFRRDLQTGITEVVSAGLPRAGDNGRPRGANDEATTRPNPRAVSSDGRYVLFESAATDLTPQQNFPAGEQLWVRDMRQGVTKLVTHRADGFSAGPADPTSYTFSRDDSTIVFASTSPALVPSDMNGASDVFAYSMSSGAVTLVSVGTNGAWPASGASDQPEISDDGRKVVFRSDATNLLPGDPFPGRSLHTYWRDLETGQTRLVDHKFDETAKRAASQTGGARLSGDGKLVLFQSGAGDIVAGYGGHGVDKPDQLYLRDMTTGGAATLVTAAFDSATRGTGGTLGDARMTPDGKTIVWNTLSTGVVEGFVDNNDDQAWTDEPDLYIRRFDGVTPSGPAKLAVHMPTGESQGVTYAPYARGLSADGRFVVVHIPTRQCDCSRWQDSVVRLDVKRNKLNNVAEAANDEIFEITTSADAKRIAFSTNANNLLDGFVDANGQNGEDVFTWYDAPPVAAADSRVTGSLKLAFDASDSADSDGEVVLYSWSFGDTKTAEGIEVEHLYPEEKNYDVKLTIEDDGGNEVVYAFEVVAIKGVLTTGGQPIDFIGIDKYLRCSVVRDGPVLAQGGGACGTFVAHGGKTYGPPELVAGTENYTPVSQERTEDGDTAKLVTVVALGETGVQVRQTDAYKGGKAWYRTDVELLNAADTATTATVYRAARCAIGAEAGRRSLHDAGTSMAGCDGSATSGRLVAAWLPLAAGARRDAGAFDAVFGRIAAGQPLADTCNCGTQPDPAAAIGWPAEIPAKGSKTLGSLAAFGPDGSIPITLAFKADKNEVQPLDDNAFTVTLRNPNAGDASVPSIAADHAGAWDAIPGATTGMTTVNPTVEGNVATWTADMKVAGHATGELRFGVTHRSGQRTATTNAMPAGEVASLVSTGIADMGAAQATVIARPIEGSKPNTAITSGPTGATTNRTPEFKLESSKDEVSYECRFGDDAWAPCTGNPHTPGPLADGPYVLEARAVDAFGADETPAKRTFIVDTAAPTTTIASGPKPLISDPRPAFFFSASEAGARFECRLEGPGRPGAWFACENPYRPAALPDGAWVFEVKAVDAAGNDDKTPARLAFTLDTTPPVTTIDGVTGKVLGANRNAAPTASGAGSTVALGADGAAALNVACPATGPACEGTLGLAQTPPTAGASQVRAVPDNAVTLARVEFSAQPGETVGVKLPLSATVRNTVERAGRMAVFITLDLGTGRAIRGSDIVLTPDPRTARLLDAGRDVKVKGGKAKLRLACPKSHAGACQGTVRIGTRNSAKFTVKAGATKVVRVPLNKAGRKAAERGKEMSVLLKTRLASSKRLTLTLRAQEARR